MPSFCEKLRKHTSLPVKLVGLVGACQPSGHTKENVLGTTYQTERVPLWPVASFPAQMDKLYTVGKFAIVGLASVR